MRTFESTLTSQIDEHVVTEQAREPSRAVVDEVAASLAVQRLVQRLVTVMRTAHPEPQACTGFVELEIARVVARGLPNKAIASVLQISTWTVSSHLRRVFSKLDVTSRAEMVGRLLADGHIPAHLCQEHLIHE